MLLREDHDVASLSPAELRRLVGGLVAEVARLAEENAALRDEVARLKGLKGRPKIKPSGMERATASRGERPKRKAKGSAKTAKRVVAEEQILAIDAPPGSRFKGYEDFVVQELRLEARVIRYRRQRWLTPDGRTLVAPLPRGVQGHIGPELHRFVLLQHHQGQVTTERITAFLNSLGVAISKRQVVRLLTAKSTAFVDEAKAVLRAGLESACWITVDDTGARHQAKNGVTTQIGDDRFAFFATSFSKSRRNFLEILRAGHDDYVLNAAAFAYMHEHDLAGPVIDQLIAHPLERFPDQAAWLAHLDGLGIAQLRVNPNPVKIATEGALWGSIRHHGLLDDTVIVSDDAGQFRIASHALCWIHAERLVHKLIPSAASGCRAGPPVDLVVLRRSQGLQARPLPPATNPAARTLRSHLPAPHRLRHPRPPARPPPRPQGRVAPRPRPARDPAPHQRLGERHPLPRHQAQGLWRHLE